jgi:hypothetical protein
LSLPAGRFRLIAVDDTLLRRAYHAKENLRVARAQRIIDRPADLRTVFNSIGG